MILFRGLNCPSSISFVEVSERGIVKVSARSHTMMRPGKRAKST